MVKAKTVTMQFNEKKRRTNLNFNQKKDIIDYYKNNKHMSHEKIAIHFTKLFNIKVARRTISDLLKSSTFISTKFLESNDNMCRSKALKYGKTDKMLIEWIEHAIHMNYVLSDDLIRMKAIEFSKSVGENDFEASNGWLYKFKRRNNLSAYILSGETADIDPKSYVNELAIIREILETYSKRNIFNMDETGLYYRAIPTKTITNKPRKGF